MKRRKHSKEFKLQVVKEALKVGIIVLVARYDLQRIKAYEEGQLGEDTINSPLQLK